MMRFVLAVGIAGLLLAGPAVAEPQVWLEAVRKPVLAGEEADAGRYAVGRLEDGAVLKNPVVLRFHAEGMKIAHANDMTPGTGHFHLLIDTEMTPEKAAFAIPTDGQHIHYGQGQTEATLVLPSGRHRLQVVMGDGAHMLHTPPVMSAPVTVTVAP